MRKIVLIILFIIVSNSISTSYVSEFDPNLNPSIIDSNNLPGNTVEIDAAQVVNHDGNISPGEYDDQVSIDVGSNFELYYTLDGSIIYIAIVADYLGYISIGFGANMEGADFVSGYFDGTSVIEDGYGPGGTSYQMDTIQNVLSSAASENSTSTIIEFSRYLDTGDAAQDNIIQLGVPTELVWAVSTSDSIGYHDKRGYATATFNTFAPLPPDNVVAIPGDSRVDLNWTATRDGGSPITNYHIFRSTISNIYGSALGTISGDLRGYSDVSVNNGETYYYVIKSENANGISEQSSEVMVIPSGVITAPRNLVAVVSDGMVNLTWHAPTTDGGSPVTNYTIYRAINQGGPYSPIGANTSATGYVDDTVINGFTYMYVVTASNANSESENSNEVTASPVGTPPPPRYLSANLGNDNITINWEVPVSDGGFPINSYRVYRSDIIGGPYIFIGTNTSDTAYYAGIVLDLKTYYFVITANNVVGESDYSNELSVKFAKVPYAPENISITVAYNQAVLNWSEPYDNGYAIEQYQVYRATTDGGPYIKIGTTNTTEYEDLTVSNGQIYFYVVAAENAQGIGLYSIQVFAEPGSTPDIPVRIKGKPGSQLISLNWTIPANTGGLEIDNYNIYRSETEIGNYTKISNTTTTFYTDYNLTNGISYYYSISATNEKGEGDRSNPIELIPGISPSIIQDITATSYENIVSINWSEPYNGGYDIIEYRIYRSYKSGGSYAYIGTSTSGLKYIDHYSILGVPNYYVVSSVNSMGESNYSSEVNATIIINPSSPQSLVAASETTHAGLLWNKPINNGGSQILQYNIYRSLIGDGNYTLLGNTTDLSFLDSGLAHNKTYYYVVTAVNEVGESEYSNSVSVYIEPIDQSISDSNLNTNKFNFDDFLESLNIGQIRSTLAYFVSFFIIGGTVIILKKYRTR